MHVEVVPSLEADACVAAITRFITWRGKPNIILSDDVTKFVGAAREIARIDGNLESNLN